jgi:transmembrane sensor
MSKAMSGSIATDLVEHALSLIAVADIQRPEKAARIRHDLDRWQNQSPAHKTAYEEALRRWHALGAVMPGLRTRFDEPKPALRKIRSRGVLCIVALVMTATAALMWQLQRPTFDQTFRTGTAQIARVSLPDGSRIDVNAQSHLQVSLYRHRRVVELTGGEARFEVTPEASKPFQVNTRAGLVKVIGTIFTVSDRGDRVRVEVEEGRVRFLGRGKNNSVDVTRGERLLAQENTPIRIEPYNASGDAEWRDGWLVFDNEPLADALLAINPYRKSPIHLADDKAGLLRLTGRFRAGDSQSLLAALPKILPITVSEDFDGKVEIRRR